jgi:hypothetical protein
VQTHDDSFQNSRHNGGTLSRGTPPKISQNLVDLMDFFKLPSFVLSQVTYHRLAIHLPFRNLIAEDNCPFVDDLPRYFSLFPWPFWQTVSHYQTIATRIFSCVLLLSSHLPKNVYTPMNSNLVVLSESPTVLYTQFFGLIILQFSKTDETQPGEPQPGAVGRPTAPVAERLLGPLRLVP